MEAFLFNFWPNFWATVLGAVTISILYFVFNGTLFRVPNMNGCWYVEITTCETKFNPYKNMKLYYQVLLFQEGNSLFGSGEKIYEDGSNGKIEYVGVHRTHIDIRGYVNRTYFTPDKVNVHYYEDSESRKSSTYYFLTHRKLQFGRTQTLNGIFNSTISSQSGTVIWSRSPLHE